MIKTIKRGHTLKAKKYYVSGCYIATVQTCYPALNAGQPGHKTRPYIRLPPSFLDMDAWMTSQLKVSLIRKLRGSLMCLAYFFDMLSLDI